MVLTGGNESAETMDELRLCVFLTGVGGLSLLVVLDVDDKLCLTEAVLVVWEEVEGVNVIPVPLLTLPSYETRDEGIGCFFYIK